MKLKIKDPRKLLLGFAIIIIGLLFCIGETKHFGYNWLPSCRAELVCDLMVLGAYAIGLRIYLKGWKIN